MTNGKCNVHLYDRIRTNAGTVLFKCLRCPHYVNGHQVLGNRAECRYCGNEFRMTRLSLQKKPHCGCRFIKKVAPNYDAKAKIPETAIKNQEFINSLLGKK